MTPTESLFVIPVGIDIRTGFDVGWTQRDLRYGGYITVAARGGKTILMSRVLSELVTRGAPAIVVDDAGTFWDEMKRAVAWKAHERNQQLIDLDFSRQERRAIISTQFLNRYSFAFLGSGSANHVGLDLLKRRQLPGRRESIEEVVSGNMRPFEARFKDIEIRTKFLSVIGPSLAGLIAAERPITELFPLLLDPQYWYFLRSEIIRLGVLNDPESRTYLVPQMQNLRRILDLRKTKGGTVEAEPYPQVYRDKIDSTIHAMEVYTPGTRSSRMFTDDTFSPESVAFGNGVFALTSDIGSELSRNLALGTVYTTFERLLKYRLPGFGNSKNRLFLMFDEVRWFYEAITRFFSVTGNHRVSTFVMNQQSEQWDLLGMPALAKVLPKLLSGLRIRDAAGSRETADDMALRDARYDPFGLQHRVMTSVASSGESDSDAESESESQGESHTSGSQEGESRGYGQNRSVSDRFGSGYSYRSDTPGDQTFSQSQDLGSGSGFSDSVGDSWSSSESDSTSSTRGTSRTKGSSRSKGRSEVEHILTAGAAEQHLLRMQDMTQLPRFIVQLESMRGGIQYVRLNHPVRPCSLKESNRLVAEFDESSARLHESRRVTRRPYDPSIATSSSNAPTSASTPASSTSTSTPSSSRAEDRTESTAHGSADQEQPAGSGQVRPAGPKPSFTRRKPTRPRGGNRGGRRG